MQACRRAGICMRLPVLPSMAYTEGCGIGEKAKVRLLAYKCGCPHGRGHHAIISSRVLHCAAPPASRCRARRAWATPSPTRASAWSTSWTTSSTTGTARSTGTSVTRCCRHCWWGAAAPRGGGTNHHRTMSVWGGGVVFVRCGCSGAGAQGRRGVPMPACRRSRRCAACASASSAATCTWRRTASSTRGPAWAGEVRCAAGRHRPRLRL